MADSEKGTSASVDPKKKKSSLDDEIGNEFLGSWKSLSTAEDDTMDFTFGTVSSGKKKAFNFDKLDMDFNLDGDFDKLTSFKVDMPDLDFSSPSKKTAKTKESSKGGSSRGNHQGKQDCFNFSFDFNELDNFNFGSTLTEREKTSVNNLDNKAAGSGSSEHQGSKAKSAGAVGGQTDKLLVSDNKTTIVETTIYGSGTGISSIGKSPSISDNIGELVMSHAAKSLPEKTVSVTAEEVDQESHSPEKTTLTVPLAQQAANILPVQPNDMNDISQDTESDIQASSLVTKVIIEPSTDHFVADRMVAGGSNHENSQLKISAGSCTNASDSKRGESEKTDSDIPVGNMTGNEPMQDDSYLEATSAVSPLQGRPHEINVDNIQKSTSKVLLPLRSSCDEPVKDKVMRIKEKEKEVVCSKFFKSSKETEPQPCQPLSAGFKISSFGSKEIASSCPANGKREGINVKDVQTQIKLTGNSKLPDMELTKGRPVLLGSENKNLCDIRGNVNPASSTDNATKSNARTSVISSTGSTLKSKMISVEGLKAAKRISDLSSMKISRTMEVSEDQSKTVLRKRNLEKIMEVRKDQSKISPLINSEKTMELQVIAPSKIVCPVVNAERKTLLLTSLKRKTSEVSNDDVVKLIPQKRLSQSPRENRNLKDSLESTAEEECYKHGNRPESDTANLLHNTTGHELPEQLSSKEQNISLAMENDGNVEKAEAYVKELEDICSMLKKKHEEAKELLVRAVVNNNSLLMLNHPMFDEKIFVWFRNLLHRCTFDVSLVTDSNSKNKKKGPEISPFSCCCTGICFDEQSSYVEFHWLS